MKILAFLLGLFLGWTFAIIKPPPKWFSQRIEKLLNLTHQKIETKLEETEKGLRDKTKEKFESNAKKLEKKLK